MKKIVLAFDSFKGSVNSTDIAQTVSNTIHQVFPCCNVVSFPIADGGEGTTAAICSGLSVEEITCQSHDPLMNPIGVSYAITKDGKVAILEMASSSGLPLIKIEDRNPMLTSTYGIGEIIKDALHRGCRKFIMGIGGSATNDAGIGMLAALGFRFLDKEGKELNPCGGNLERIDRIDESVVDPLLKETSFMIACDVNNPFSGKDGAAFIYAPQKGASPEMVEKLDAGLKHYSQVIKRQKNVDIENIPGAGAAGGMGGGLLPFFNAELKSGIETILDILHFEEALQDADLVLTGEGKLDEQTAMGKALGGILKAASKKDVPVIAIGGGVEAVDKLNEMGFTAVLSIQQQPISLELAMQKEIALRNIETTVSQLMRIIKQYRYHNTNL